MNKKFKIMSFLIIFLIIVLFSTINYCADGSLSASQSTSGDKITVNIKSSKALGAFTLKVSGLTPTSGESDVGEFGGNSIAGVSMKGTTSLGKFIFAVPNNDTKVTFSVSGVADSDGNDLTISSTTITLKAKKTTSTETNNKPTSDNNNTTTTPTKSNNAYLSTLGVTPKEYDFSGFSKTKTSYSVTVPSTVDSLKVVAKAADSKATVKVSGNSGFEVGSNNTIKVVVTAEDGKTTKTYTIKVTKLAEDEEKPGNVIEDDKGLYLTSLSIEGLEISPKFAKDTYSYTATLSDSSVNEVKVKAVSNKEKAKIDISGNTNLVEGENTINLVLTLDGSTEQTVYQIVLTKEGESLVATTTKLENTPNSNNDLMETIKKYVGIAIAVIVLVILAIIVLIILLRRENKRLKEEDNIDEDNEEYNVYKNDVNEFENNENLEKENFIESLYNQRNKTELDEQDKQTMNEINKQTEEILKEKKVEGQSVEYGTNEFADENPLEERQRRRGKHF